MPTVPEQVKQLFDLLQAGAISQEEYDAQKAALLAEGLDAARKTGSQPTLLTEVGAYRLLGLIGEGGMGAVYRGRHRTEARASNQGGDVAVKVMHPQYARNEEYRARFEREASLGLTLDDPHIVKVHDLVVDGGTLALVMELVEGRPLSAQVGEVRGPIPWGQAWPMVQVLLGAVGQAHARGIVHRDLKPDNVLITPDGAPHVIDFGIARGLDGPSTATGTGMGTIEYMAPEQYTDAKGVDLRADVYSLGMMLYEMLAGRLPWEAEATPYQIMQQKADRQLVSPAAFCPEIPPEIVGALAPALAVRPGDRYPSIESFEKALEDASGRAAVREEEEQRRAQVAARRRTSPPEPPARTTVIESPDVPSVPSIPERRPPRSTSTDDEATVVTGMRKERTREVVRAVVALISVLVVIGGIYLAIRLGQPYRVESSPSGAEVRAVGTGEILGTTPMEWSEPGDVPLEGVCVVAERSWAECVEGEAIVDARSLQIDLEETPEIRVVTDPPDATVGFQWVDGSGATHRATIGYTPVSWRVPGHVALPGATDLELHASLEGYATQFFPVTLDRIRVGSPFLIRLAPASTLRITSHPEGADVDVRGPLGVHQGTTPLDVVDIPAGEYSVAVSMPGYVSRQSTASLQIGEEERLHLRLIRGQDHREEGSAGETAGRSPASTGGRAPEPGDDGSGGSLEGGDANGASDTHDRDPADAGAVPVEDGGPDEGLSAMGTHSRGQPGAEYGAEAGHFSRNPSGTPSFTSEETTSASGEEGSAPRGSLEKPVIDRVVKQHLAQIRYCYQKELNKNPGLHGKIVVRFVIAVDGTVSSARIDSSSMNNPILEKCVCARFRDLEFPRPEGGGRVTVTYPFSFKPG